MNKLDMVSFTNNLLRDVAKTQKVISKEGFIPEEFLDLKKKMKERGRNDKMS